MGMGHHYPCILMLIVNMLRIHDIQQHLECHDEIGVDDGPGLISLVVREAALVDYPHLPYNCRFSGFPSTYISNESILLTCALCNAG